MRKLHTILIMAKFAADKFGYTDKTILKRADFIYWYVYDSL